MGLLQPVYGNFKVDNSVITELNRHSWQSIIAHVPQSIFLIDGSIKENIALGVQGIGLIMNWSKSLLGRLRFMKQF